MFHMGAPVNSAGFVWMPVSGVAVAPSLSFDNMGLRSSPHPGLSLQAPASRGEERRVWTGRGTRLLGCVD